MSFAPVQSIKGSHVSHGSDAGLYVEFYMESLHDVEASEKEGRPIYRDTEFIKIIPVGDKNTVVCRPVELKEGGQAPPDNVRWPQQYAAFKNQQKQVIEGTTLLEWGVLTKSQALMMKAVNVHTVEQLAEVSDSNLNNLGMGGRDFRDRAKLYIANAKDGSGITQLKAENDRMQGEIEALKNQIKAIADNKKKSTKKGK